VWQFKHNNSKTFSNNVDVPEFVNNKNLTKKRGDGKRAKFLNFRASVLNYFMSDCNIGENVINKSNINLLVDDDTKEILIKGSGKGKLCLDIVSKGVIEQIANENGYESYNVNLEDR
jgi:hypothetical protein